MLQAESYIVRIYRRESPSQMKGVVEVVRTGKRIGFASSEELWAVLAPGRCLPANKRPTAKRG
jgi:hypothetical protein